VSHRRDALLAVVTLGVLVGVAYWARNTLRATAFNRRVSVTGLFVFVGQIILSLGAASLGLSVVEAQVFMIFYWGVITTMLAISLEAWLAPSAALYFVWFAVAAHAPELRYYAMAAANLGFSINAFLRWTPGTLRATEAERAAREERDAKARARRRV